MSNERKEKLANAWFGFLYMLFIIFLATHPYILIGFIVVGVFSVLTKWSYQTLTNKDEN